MRTLRAGWVWLVLTLGVTTWGAPLGQLRSNPHYLEYGGRPVVLVGSGEHYGAVLNLDFDYRKYLRTLAADGLNLTRTFTGAYVEPAGAFGIERNTLAPVGGRFICPWARSTTPGYAGGGNRFDLERWDEGYFVRLKDFLREAARCRVVVELNLFCPFYDEAQWRLSPQNARNNVNGVGQVARTNVYTLDQHGGLLSFHEALVRRLVRELNSFDNLYYEICNEPYFGGVTEAWQRRIAEVIVEAESGLPHRHLISQNIANGAKQVTNPHPAVSILNFHYAHPPDAVAMNWRLGRVVGDNETGFRGTNDLPYRVEAWSFLMAGGGLFNHLDYSFVAGAEEGTFVYPAAQPGGGNPGLRRQFAILAEFVRRLEVWTLEPMQDLTVEGEGLAARGLGRAGKAYGVYVGPAGGDWKQPVDFSGRLVAVSWSVPAGRYRVVWSDPATGDILKRSTVRHDGGRLKLELPRFREDLLVRLTR